MSGLEIITNNKPRDIIGWNMIPKDVQEQDFDWVDESIEDDMNFFAYKGKFYCLEEYMAIRHCPYKEFEGWDGYSNDSAFSGTLIKYVNDFESVVVATFMS